jgi:hypothetical protein
MGRSCIVCTSVCCVGGPRSGTRADTVEVTTEDVTVALEALRRVVARLEGLNEQLRRNQVQHWDALMRAWRTLGAETHGYKGGEHRCLTSNRSEVRLHALYLDLSGVIGQDPVCRETELGGR